MADFSSPGTIVITGASSGIGAGLAQDYAAAGIQLGLIGRDAERLERTAQACRQNGAAVESSLIDVRDAAALESWLLSYDGAHAVDLVVANAGIASAATHKGGLEAAENVRDVFAVNLLGAINTVLPLIEPMRQRGHGQLALMASLASLWPLPNTPSYSASKAGVRYYGEALRPRLARDGIGVTVICPGFVTTPMTESLKGPTPGLMSVAEAVRRIRGGLAGNPALLAFPRPLALALRLMDMLPRWVSGRIWRKFDYSAKR